MTGRMVQRAQGVVWRQAHDRVLVRRIGDHSDKAQADLHGVAALVWVALDQPMSVEQLTVVLADAGLTFDPDEIDAAIALTTAERWTIVDGDH
jgi:hypothetical protein